MKILFKNIIENNSGISATNQSLNYPVGNIAHPFLKKRFKSTGTTSLIIIDFDTDQCVSCFFWGYHSMTSFDVEFKNSVGTVLHTLNITTTPNTQVDSEYFPEITTVRSIEMTINDSTGVYLGGLGAGCCFTMPNFISEYKKGNQDSSFDVESNDGQSLQNYSKPKRVYGLNFGALNDETTNLINDEYVLVGIGKPLYIDIFENLQSKEPPIYAKILTALNFNKNKLSATFALQIREAR